jgi:hypothetical protein
MDFKRKIYLTSFAFLSFSVVLVFSSLYLFKGIQKEASELISLKREIALVQLKTKNFENFQKDYKAYQKNLKKMGDLLNYGLFIDPEIPVDFVNFLEKEANLANLETQISPAYLEKKEEDPWDFLAFRIKSTGDFQGLAQFIERLENCQWLIDIVSLEMKFNEKKGAIETNLLIKAYAQTKRD